MPLQRKKADRIPVQPAQTSKDVDLSNTPEEWTNEDGGELYQKYIEKKRWSKEPEAYKKATGKAIDEYMKDIVRKETEKWTEQNWTQSILSSLQTGYGDIASELENYEVVYEEMKLPDGRLLQDVPMDEITRKKTKR